MADDPKDKFDPSQMDPFQLAAQFPELKNMKPEELAAAMQQMPFGMPPPGFQDMPNPMAGGGGHHMPPPMAPPGADGQHPPGMGLPPLTDLPPLNIPPELLQPRSHMADPNPEMGMGGYTPPPMSPPQQPQQSRPRPRHGRDATTNKLKAMAGMGAKKSSPQKPEAAAVEERSRALEKKEVSRWSCLLHLSGLLMITGIPFLNIIVTTMLWLPKKDKHPYIARQGREVINFQLSLLGYQFICLLVGVFLVAVAPGFVKSLLQLTQTVRMVFSSAFYIPMNLFTAIPFCFGLLCGLCGVIAAYQGHPFRYPFTMQILPKDRQRVTPTVS